MKQNVISFANEINKVTLLKVWCKFIVKVNFLNRFSEKNVMKTASGTKHSTSVLVS